MNKLLSEILGREKNYNEKVTAELGKNGLQELINRQIMEGDNYEPEEGLLYALFCYFAAMLRRQFA